MEECNNLIDTWFQGKIIIPAVTALICSGLIPFLHHKYKIKRERAEKLFETRKNEYQSYFKILENAAKLAGQDYVEFMQKTLPDATRRLHEEGFSTDSIFNYQKVLNDFTIGIQEGFQKATSELTGLRIVCSRNLISKLDEFESLYKELLTMQPEMLRQLKEKLTLEAFLSESYNFESEIQQKMVEKGEALKNLRNQIIDTMRDELGYES